MVTLAVMTIIVLLASQAIYSAPPQVSVNIYIHTPSYFTLDLNLKVWIKNTELLDELNNVKRSIISLQQAITLLRNEVFTELGTLDANLRGLVDYVNYLDSAVYYLLGLDKLIMYYDALGKELELREEIVSILKQKIAQLKAVNEKLAPLYDVEGIRAKVDENNFEIQELLKLEEEQEARINEIKETRNNLMISLLLLKQDTYGYYDERGNFHKYSVALSELLDEPIVLRLYMVASNIGVNKVATGGTLVIKGIAFTDSRPLKISNPILRRMKFDKLEFFVRDTSGRGRRKLYHVSVRWNGTYFTAVIRDFDAYPGPATLYVKYNVNREVFKEVKVPLKVEKARVFVSLSPEVVMAGEPVNITVWSTAINYPIEAKLLKGDKTIAFKRGKGIVMFKNLKLENGNYFIKVNDKFLYSFEALVPKLKVITVQGKNGDVKLVLMNEGKVPLLKELLLLDGEGSIIFKRPFYLNPGDIEVIKLPPNIIQMELRMVIVDLDKVKGLKSEISS